MIRGLLEKTFLLKENGTTIKTELLAGFTTFMTMAYIIVVNPSILSATGMPVAPLMTTTILASAITTLIMAFYAKLPFALAPGMGLNAFFAFTICLGMGKSWQFALTAVFLEGLIFMLLTLANVREAIIDSLPDSIKKAISVGIGLFIAFIGLTNAAIILPGSADSVPLLLGNIAQQGPALLALCGLIITGSLLVLRIKGAIFFGILATTMLGIPMGVTTISNFSIFSMPASIGPIFMKFEWHNIFTLDMAIILFTLLFIDLFNTIGTLVGVCTKSNLLDNQGRIPRVKQALLTDAIGTTLGAIMGTSTVTTYVESAAGVTEGGRTGLTSATVALLFLVSLFLSPLFLVVPAAATAPALILVGLFMLSPINTIDLNDYTEAIPAFLTIIMMPLAYSISDGLAIGVISYVTLKLITGKVKKIKVFTLVLAIIFVSKYLFI